MNQMKIRMAIVVVLLIGAAALGGTYGAPQDDGFGQFYAGFKAAVKADAKDKVAGMINFEKFDWESNESLRQIKTREAFLKNYIRMFTPTVKNKIFVAKPTKSDNGDYFIT